MRSTDSGPALADRSLAAARKWLAAETSREHPAARTPERNAQRSGSPPREPLTMLCSDPTRWRALAAVDAAAASGASAAEWAAVLDSLLVLAIRRYDLDALATLLLGCAEFGLTQQPIPARAVGFLLAQQQVDGGFGFVPGTEEPADTAIRIALTRRCVQVLQRICEPHDSRMRKNPSSRSPSPAIP
ncbi:hypothetical protein [Nocardia sp. SC052]|uniref:hypothetical protein n=1 Tax=Nocardia sichangensis TaxID=3385975 RepID=UPI0039A11392